MHLYHGLAKKKIALCIYEGEYVFVSSCCTQILYMKLQFENFKLIYDHIPIRCDHANVINLLKNYI